MELTIGFWQFGGMLAGLASFFLMALAGLSKLLLSQFAQKIDARFDAQEEVRKQSAARWEQQFRSLDDSQRRFDKEMADLRLELAKQYVRREDAIRDQTVIQAKLDALAAKVELLTQVMASAKRTDGNDH